MTSAAASAAATAGIKRQRSVEMFDTPVTRKQTYTSLPRPVQCALCNRLAYCKVMYDLGEVIKVEFLCKECCRGSGGNN